MNIPLQACIRVGIVHFAAYPSALSGENVLPTLRELAEDPFFVAVEVTSVKDPEERAEVAALLAHSGMAVGYGAQPVQLSQKLDLGAAEPGERERALTALKRCVDEAYLLGAERFVLLSGPDVTGQGRQTAVDRTVAALIEIAAYSRTIGSMPFCLESFDFDVDKRRPAPAA